MAVLFHNTDVKFKPTEAKQLKQWVTDVIHAEGFTTGTINYIFCSDEYLLQVNKDHLDHDYYTDIITFDMSDDEDTVSSDLFISIDRVKDNAIQLNVSFEEELHRVMIHGILHLVGYNDKTEEEQKEMRLTENQYITQLKG